MARPPTGLRERLLESALRSFVQRGFRGTSLADIAADVGCSKASLLYHFSSKEAILAELLLPVGKEAAALDSRLAGLGGAEAAETAVAGFTDLVVRFRREMKLLFDNLSELHEITSLSDACLESLEGFDERLIGALTGRSAEPEGRVAALMALGGMFLAGASDRLPPADDDTLREVITATALRALGHTRH